MLNKLYGVKSEQKAIHDIMNHIRFTRIMYIIRFDNFVEWYINQRNHKLEHKEML